METNTNTDTIFESLGGDGVLNIVVQPALSAPNAVGARLNLTPDYYVINNKPIISGNLCMILKNNARDIDFTIEDKQGTLIVSAEDSKNFSIDENGHLLYTYK